MSFNTNWDVNDYKTDYESDEHWQLRKRFMEVHKDKFPEEKLVCLAQVFTNVEFMGCRYPDETMKTVAHLSQEVAKDFREQRAKRLKRTFVKASDAAEARAKGRRDINKSTSPITNRNFTFNTGTEDSISTFSAITEASLFDNLVYGKFVLYLTGDRNALQVSCLRSNSVLDEKESAAENNSRKVEIFINGKSAGFATAAKMKLAKQLAFDNAIENLSKECFTIKNNPESDRINITKKDKTVKCSVKTSEKVQKLDANNIGYRMLQKLGWSGGGLGSGSKGREDPLDYLIKNNRKGLGNSTDDLNDEYFKNLVANYLNSDDIRDLYFESGFTKAERAALHQIASQQQNLKSTSYGKEKNRHLIISKKNISPYRIITEVLLNKNAMFINKYEVTVPAKKLALFSDI